MMMKSEEERKYTILVEYKDLEKIEIITSEKKPLLFVGCFLFFFINLLFLFFHSLIHSFAFTLSADQSPVPSTKASVSKPSALT
jgi:hypothetical protein